MFARHYKMESYGLVKMKTGTRGSKKPFVPYSDIVLDMSIGSSAQRVVHFYTYRPSGISHFFPGAMAGILQP